MTPESIRIRDEYVARGLLRKDVHASGELVIYTYTDRRSYAGAWDDVTLNSRGHIFSASTGECVARPFSKFFNVGERPESASDRFDWSSPYDVYTKVDGWLGVHYRHNGRHCVASRGSFRSAPAQWATEELQRHDLMVIPWAATLCFEIVGPQTKIILPYAENKLVLLAAFDRLTGVEYPRATIVRWASLIGVECVESVASRFHELQEAARAASNVEGWVIRFADGTRVKLKTDWYQRISRAMRNVTPLEFWRNMRGGTVQQSVLKTLSPECRPQAEAIASHLESQYRVAHDALVDACRGLIDAHHGDRRSIGLAIPSMTPLQRKAVFGVLDDKVDIVDDAVMSSIRPDKNQYAEVVE